MRVICIGGKAQHGKDTLAKYLKEGLEQRGKRVQIIHYGDLLKYICTMYFNWNGKKDEAGRTLLQKVGTDKIRSRNPNFWVAFVADLLDALQDEWDYVLIPDTRFVNEVELMKTCFIANTTYIRVVRTGFDNGLTEEQKNHISETALDDYEPDIYVYNHRSLEDLRVQAENLIVRDFEGV